MMSSEIGGKLRRLAETTRIRDVALAIVCSFALTMTVMSGSASAQSIKNEINQNTVSVLAGNPAGTYLFIAADLAAALDDSDNLRVLAMVGKGGAQNIRDLLYLRNIDTAIVRNDAIDMMEGEPYLKGLRDRLRYVTKLYNEEVHLIVGPNIKTVEDLRGKTVNFSNKGSATTLTSRNIFNKLGVEVNETNFHTGDALQKLGAGEIDAVMQVAGKPVKSVRNVPEGKGLHIISIPYIEALESTYSPATLTSADYPNLIKEGDIIETVSSSAVLASFNWQRGTDRYRRVENLTKALFANFERLQAPARHPKWGETNLAAELRGGWTRFQAAQDLLDEAKATNSVAEQSGAEMRKLFAKFIQDQGGSGAVLTKAQEDALFNEFLKWRKQASTN
ncbi:MAG: TAXI family TRAP transporter solute-binding subunit [Stappiaceae bacterium]